MNSFKVENILVFGEKTVPAQKEDLALIIGNPSNLLHILRHFPTLSKNYTNQLIGQEYEYYDYQTGKYQQAIITNHDLESAYQTTGSKFYPAIPGLENPTAVIDLIKTELEKLIDQKSAFWIIKPHQKTLLFTINYAQAVGDKNLVPLDQIPPEFQNKILSRPRGTHSGENSVIIKAVSGVNKFPTKRISVQISHLPDKNYAKITAYPGELAPGFPTPNQSPSEFQYSLDFWNSHVFIE